MTTGRHRSPEHKATVSLVRATYLLAIATLALVLVTAVLVFHTSKETTHDCPIVPAVTHERRVGE
jgi:hypothetical protein